MIASVKRLGLDEGTVNTEGGAIALELLGASGVRLALMLLGRLEQNGRAGSPPSPSASGEASRCSTKTPTRRTGLCAVMLHLCAHDAREWNRRVAPEPQPLSPSCPARRAPPRHRSRQAGRGARPASDRRRGARSPHRGGSVSRPSRRGLPEPLPKALDEIRLFRWGPARPCRKPSLARTRGANLDWRDRGSAAAGSAWRINIPLPTSADSSALVKLVRDEPDAVLRAFFVAADLVSCELVLTWSREPSDVPRRTARGSRSTS